MSVLVDVFKCEKCGYEDSIYIPKKAKGKDCIECPKCKEKVKANIETEEIGKFMTLEEYNSLIKYIQDLNKNSKDGEVVKVVTNTIDFRTMCVHSVNIDGKVFSKSDENIHRDLKKWIMGYLENNIVIY